MPLASAAPAIAGFAVLYVIVFVVLGLRCLKKGHWIMFIIGIPVPLFWIIGALIPPVQR